MLNRVNFSRKDHLDWLDKICELAIDDEVALLGEPIPLMADLARLAVVGMGLDEHPRPNARVRNLAANFKTILDGIERPLTTEEAQHAAARVRERVPRTGSQPVARLSKDLSVTSIPKPTFPGPRPRRSSIAQAAAVNRGTTENAPTQTADTPPSTAQPVPARHFATDRSCTHTRRSRPVRSSRIARSHAACTTPTRNGTTRTNTTTSTSNKRLAQSRDILLSVPDDLKDRMVNTIAWTTPHTGITHQQKFIRRGIAELCDRLEKQFNDGKPFPAPAAADD